MGITGELVRGVFSKGWTNDNKKNLRLEKKRWRRSSMRAYLCGDELFNSVIAEEDSASLKSSQATITQVAPPSEDSFTTINGGCYYTNYTQSQDDNYSEKDQSLTSSISKPFDHEDTAATVIQSAFRGFMVRRLMPLKYEGVKNDDDFIKGMESPSKESLATSIEVQTGNSIGVVSTQEEAPSVSNKMLHKPKPQISKPKEDWDDSMVDSSVSKMRMQSRLEAMTRRERALAYAFSQQLRICPKRKHMKSDGTEPNMGWSWLERWMATRHPEASVVEDRRIITKQLSELSDMKTSPSVRKKFLD